MTKTFSPLFVRREREVPSEGDKVFREEPDHGVCAEHLRAEHVRQHARVVVEVDGEHFPLLGGLDAGFLDGVIQRSGEEDRVRGPVARGKLLGELDGGQSLVTIII